MMDNLRGFDSLNPAEEAEAPDYAQYSEDQEDVAIEAPPVVSGDERRMQVRAYNFWTSQLGEKNYPPVEELNPEDVDDFRDYSVLLDFTSGIENPSIPYLGDELRQACELGEDISYLDQVPPRSLLSRITDHYLQIIANRAPIGFEAEFVNDNDVTIMYRGILLPYSSDDDTIDFIYGVINWKEVAAADVTSELQAEVEQADLDNHLLQLHRQQATVQARINALLNRAPDAPLPTAAPIVNTAVPPALETLQTLAMGQHPELAGLDAQVAANQNRETLAEKAFYPSCQGGVGYNSLWDAPDKRPVFAVSINVPSLSKRKQLLITPACT